MDCAPMSPGHVYGFESRQGEDDDGRRTGPLDELGS